MLDFPTSAQGRRERPDPDPVSDPLDKEVRAFLIKSERRVIAHCRQLLAGQHLAMEHRQRLIRLIDRAEAELQRLAA